MKCVNKYKNFILLTIGTLLIILSLCLLFYDKVVLLQSNVFDEIELEKYRENNTNNNSINDNNDNNDNDLVINDIDTDDLKDNVVESSKDTQKKVKEYIGYLEIEKIKLKQGLVSKKSYYNNVNRNIQIIDKSDYPDKVGGNLILAAHSGTSSISYFKNLYQLENGDEAKVYYNGYVYYYKIVNIYNVLKTGTVVIYRDLSKNCLTLITCTYKSNTEQTVYILELTNVVKESGT